MRQTTRQLTWSRGKSNPPCVKRYQTNLITSASPIILYTIYDLGKNITQKFAPCGIRNREPLGQNGRQNVHEHSMCQIAFVVQKKLPNRHIVYALSHFTLDFLLLFSI